MKDTLIEIKNNLQGNNSRVDGAKNQINDLGHKEDKNKQTSNPPKTKKQSKKTTRTMRRKKESKKMRVVQGASGITSGVPTFTS